MARSVIRQSGSQYSDLEMAAFGLLPGCSSLLRLVGGISVPGLNTTQTVATRNGAMTDVQTRLADARGLLLMGCRTETFGVSTDSHDAEALARRFVDTLHVRDSLEFRETGESEDIPPREYRVYVRLNEDSAADLACVPEFERSTEEAITNLYDTCRRMGRRSVDDILAEGRPIGVGVNSTDGVEMALKGRSLQEGSTEPGIEKVKRSEQMLHPFFRLPGRKTGPASISNQSSSGSRNDICIESELIPAEVESLSVRSWSSCFERVARLSARKGPMTRRAEDRLQSIPVFTVG